MLLNRLTGSIKLELVAGFNSETVFAVLPAKLAVVASSRPFYFFTLFHTSTTSKVRAKR